MYMMYLQYTNKIQCIKCYVQSYIYYTCGNCTKKFNECDFLFCFVSQKSKDEWKWQNHSLIQNRVFDRVLAIEINFVMNVTMLCYISAYIRKMKYKTRWCDRLIVSCYTDHWFVREYILNVSLTPAHQNLKDRKWFWNCVNEFDWISLAVRKVQSRYMLWFFFAKYTGTLRMSCAHQLHLYGLWLVVIWVYISAILWHIICSFNSGV